MLGGDYGSASFLKEFTIPSQGTNGIAAATLPLLDTLKIKSEPLEMSLSVNAGEGEKLEGPQPLAGTIILQPSIFPQTGQTISVTVHVNIR